MRTLPVCAAWTTSWTPRRVLCASTTPPPARRRRRPMQPLDEAEECLVCGEPVGAKREIERLRSLLLPYLRQIGVDEIEPLRREANRLRAELADARLMLKNLLPTNTCKIVNYQSSRSEERRVGKES